ncbi:MAG TPA: MaoC family dehydratase N-terminal domain-containing protein, partial [SAR202 cluster bacterium]|nr:MaoC family dehydratase N-terminal domain-containing protein [SAR202 cluster bacterium]
QRAVVGAGDGYCDFNFYTDIHPGDTISGYTRWTEPYEKTGRSGTLPMTTRESVIENQHGQIVSTSKRGTVHIITA